MSSQGATARQIILISSALEAVLFSVYLLWSHLRGVPLPQLAPNDLLIGAALSIPLFTLNWIIFEYGGRSLNLLRQCIEFKQQLLIPLARQLSLTQALILSVFAGIGEEFFFRGALQTEIGLVGSAVAFSLMHFGPAALRLKVIASLYFVTGLLFGGLAAAGFSLWTLSAMHGIYDFIVLCVLRHQSRGNS